MVQEAAPRTPPASPPPIIGGRHTFGTITDKISSIVLTGRTPRFWYVCFGVAFIFVLVLLFCIAAVVSIGVGLFGVMSVVGYTTKTDLTKMGSFLIMALIGLVIAMVVNIFLRSSGLEW